VTATATLGQWIEGLGLDVRVVSGAAGDELRVTPRHDAEPGLVVARRDPETREIVHDHRVSASALQSEWQAPWDPQPPAEAVSRAARDVACGFPLVETSTHEENGEVVVRFGAPVFDDGLTRQAFLLTLSSVLKAVQGFALVIARRADELAAWKEFEANTERRREEQHELTNRMTVTGPAAGAAVQAPTGPPRMGSRQPSPGAR
jgi:hypothetical protein